MNEIFQTGGIKPLQKKDSKMVANGRAIESPRVFMVCDEKSSEVIVLEFLSLILVQTNHPS